MLRKSDGLCTTLVTTGLWGSSTKAKRTQLQTDTLKILSSYNKCQVDSMNLPVTWKKADLLSLPPLEMTWQRYHPMSTLYTPVMVRVPSMELTVWRAELVTSTLEGGSDWVRNQCQLTSTLGSLETPHWRAAEEPLMTEVLEGGCVIIVFTEKQCYDCTHLSMFCMTSSIDFLLNLCVSSLLYRK